MFCGGERTRIIGSRCGASAVARTDDGMDARLAVAAVANRADRSIGLLRPSRYGGVCSDRSRIDDNPIESRAWHGHAISPVRARHRIAGGRVIFSVGVRIA